MLARADRRLVLRLALGLAAARLFVKSGVLAYRQDRGKEKEAVSAVTGDGAITINTILLTDNGTSNGAEVFAAALSGNKRAQLIGECGGHRVQR